MLIDNPAVQDKLRVVAKRLGNHLGMADDLYQEMLFHLWQQEVSRPGQKRAWYINGCILHARNHLRHGRSVDSTSRKSMRLEDVDVSEIPEPEPVADYCFESRIASDFLQALCKSLSKAKKKILELMAKGHTVGEVAKNLCISHQAVSKHLKAIRAEAAGLQAKARTA